MSEGQFMPPGTLRVLTQHLCAAGIFILLQNVEKQCTSPNAGKPAEDSNFSFPGSSAGKSS